MKKVTKFQTFRHFFINRNDGLSIDKRYLELRSSSLALGRSSKLVYARINATLRRFEKGRTAKCSHIAP